MRLSHAKSVIFIHILCYICETNCKTTIVAFTALITFWFNYLTCLIIQLLFMSFHCFIVIAYYSCDFYVHYAHLYCYIVMWFQVKWFKFLQEGNGGLWFDELERLRLDVLVLLWNIILLLWKLFLRDLQFERFEEWKLRKSELLQFRAHCNNEP